MKLSKSALFVSLFGALSASAYADVDVYGKANLSIQSSDEGEGSFTEVKSNASRFGFKGSEKLDSGLEVIYKLEFQVDVSDADSKGEDDNITARNQYVGLKGNFGEVVIGRNDTAFKQSQGKLDLFNDLEADIKNLFKGENRLGDSISYKSASFNGFKVLGTFIAEDSTEGENGFSAALTYGDAKLKNTKFYAAVATDSEVKGYDAVRFSVQGKVADFKLGAMYQMQEKVDGSDEADGYMVNAAYGFGANTLKLQYQVIDFDKGDKVDGISVGIDHKLSKAAKLYAFYSSVDEDNGVEEDYLGAGIEYKF
ncbi:MULTISPECIES: porin [unclassified Pseudoalteromonas]|uniref:porin n=1 Tax=unclassified Pseudoalteromonas TaxID=194690 RepID=UPI002096E999|nr:porin [Pseudoalteromonas sp. XMcav2-N]MCO7188875.1 porin [Pseudoalteromonas sp. XMcav2-N]